MAGRRVIRRSTNYTTEETNCLLSFLESNPEMILNTLGGQFRTVEEHWQAWDEVAERVSTFRGDAYGPQRTARDLKKKWIDLKHRVKSKVANIALEVERGGSKSQMRLSALDERVLALLSKVDEIPPEHIPKRGEQVKAPALRVFAFEGESGSPEELDESSNQDIQTDDVENLNEVINEDDVPELVTEIKSASEEKKRRISQAFSSPKSIPKRSRPSTMTTDEEQLMHLVNSQKQLNNELGAIKEILKKCQTSVEKLALLKKAELRLKCAKHGVDFDDLFD